MSSLAALREEFAVPQGVHAAGHQARKKGDWQDRNAKEKKIKKKKVAQSPLSRGNIYANAPRGPKPKRDPATGAYN